jgi:hypothetical protein
MSDDSALTVSTSPKFTLGDRIREIASQLRQEDEVQIKATSRILGAAAQLAENHDRLIDEVVEMVEEDLNQPPQSSKPQPYTVEQLKRQFSKLSDAKAHFGMKASSWTALVDKLNKLDEPITASPSSRQVGFNNSQDSIFQRLVAIEAKIQTLQGDMEQVLKILNLLADKLL